jgi:hypothetical protein
MTGRDLLTSRDVTGLVFTGEMYGVQVDQLATILSVDVRRARAVASRWLLAGYARSARIGPGPAWIWLTKSGLTACGLRFAAVSPALSRLAHIRAVTSARLALSATGSFAESGAYWRSERRLRAGYRVGVKEHLPDGEVHWPSDAPVPWAGECWAIEAELTRKTLARTTSIMRAVLARTGDYGCPAADAAVPGLPPRHARVLYVCSAAALPTVSRARALLGPLAPRVEVRSLPASAALPAP